jgi:hypothetical protein
MTHIAQRRAMNPSITRQGEHIMTVQRCVNFTFADDGDYRTFDGSPATRDFPAAIELVARASTEILPPADMPPPAFGQVLGFKDA